MSKTNAHSKHHPMCVRTSGKQCICSWLISHNSPVRSPAIGKRSCLLSCSAHPCRRYPSITTERLEGRIRSVIAHQSAEFWITQPATDPISQTYNKARRSWVNCLNIHRYQSPRILQIGSAIDIFYLDRFPQIGSYLGAKG